jgi:signal peptidase I
MEQNRVPPQPLPTPPAERPKRSVRTSLINTVSWVRDLVFSVLIAIVLIVFIYQPVKVEGTSMEPALTDQERIFINKFTYWFGLGKIQRGDTVVFWYPLDRSKSYIKRVIAVPGDLVRIEAGEVYVNDKALVEDYVPPDSRDSLSWPRGATPVDRQVPPNQYFVLGDHRSQSSDSRAWGYVPAENIYGKAVFVYWPLARLGRLR